MKDSTMTPSTPLKETLLAKRSRRESLLAEQSQRQVYFVSQNSLDSSLFEREAIEFCNTQIFITPQLEVFLNA
jgi:hypothetical protein